MLMYLPLCSYRELKVSPSIQTYVYMYVHMYHRGTCGNSTPLYSYTRLKAGRAQGSKALKSFAFVVLCEQRHGLH